MRRVPRDDLINDEYDIRAFAIRVVVESELSVSKSNYSNQVVM